MNQNTEQPARPIIVIKATCAEHPLVLCVAPNHKMQSAQCWVALAVQPLLCLLRASNGSSEVQKGVEHVFLQQLGRNLDFREHSGTWGSSHIKLCKSLQLLHLASWDSLTQ